MARKKVEKQEEPQVVEVLDNPDLAKNMETGTVIFKNTSAIDARRRAKEQAKKDKVYVSSLEERISQLETLISNLVSSN